MSEIIYSLCLLTSALCFGLLWRGWRQSRSGILFWSALCFAALSANNLLLVIDKILIPVRESLIAGRLGMALLAVGLLLWGLIFEER